MDTAIKLTDISHAYKDKTVLDKINTEAAVGEIFGLLGPSGAGKTTMIKILTGQIRQNSGLAYLIGTDTRQLTGDVYMKLGLMLDNLGLYERLTCVDNLKVTAKIHGIEKKHIMDVLESVGLKEAAGKTVMKLSKGMRQRLLFARAILNNPEIMFLDEPTSGLDPATAVQIHQLIREQQRMGSTIFITTHNMEEAAKLCDHIVLLHEGHIIEYGSPEEICNRYNHQNKLRIMLRDGRSVILDNNRASASRLMCYMENEEIHTIHSTEPNLESVFLELTGRKFE